MFWATVDLIGVASIFMDLETENRSWTERLLHMGTHQCPD